MQFIKNIVVYFFIAGVVFPSETAHAITFVPDFIDHYQHHNEEHHQLSFIDFVLEHADGGHDEKGQHPEDDCPVDHNHNIVLQHVYYLEENNIKIEEDQNNIPVVLTSPLPKYVFCQSEYIANIWQPPKIN